ncbi:MAG: beta-eliminating lyase-related protein [Thermoflexales bacterium]|nr:beta-eliminating lyase-related protein [Thermoflexales bacterium]MDW8351838.1 beta-eliminating lyase-related protein [Anaerolineae bacterium]
MTRRGFASDNNAGIHPEILQAIAAANQGHVLAYGDDPYTQRAVDAFKRHFGDDIAVYFVFNGTAANTLGLAAVMRSYQAVICASTAHIHCDECGAPEKFAGVKLLTCMTPHGKLSVEHVRQHMHGLGDEHRAQPGAISITQSTELGTVYTPDEIRALADYAHAHGLLLHMDGARICNAAAALDLPLRALTRDAGVDVLSFGGTKNGLLGGEAVIFFPPRALAADFKFIRKQGMQLASKMRFIGAQFEALLCGDLWQRNAANANAMARRLADRVRGIVEIAYPVQANAVFAIVPKRRIADLRAYSFFYEWADLDGERAIVRWMCAWDTTAEDVDGFAAHIAEVLREA